MYRSICTSICLGLIVAAAAGGGCAYSAGDAATDAAEDAPVAISRTEATLARSEAAPPARDAVPRGGIQSIPLDKGSPAVADNGPLFELLSPEQTGVDFQMELPDFEKHVKELLFLNPMGGICTGDYDGDGLVDFYVPTPGGHRLYRNLGDFRFRDVTAEVGIAEDRFWGTGATFVDIDNDGDLDLYACAYAAPNRLYINGGPEASGTVRFEERAQSFGLGYDGASMTMAFADMDNDGDLDGYLATTALSPPKGTRFRVIYEGEVPTIPPHLREYWQFIYLPGERVIRAEAGQFDHLYRNDNGRFVDVSTEAGIDGTFFTLAAAWWDYNQDGLPDIYVSNDFYGPDMLYRNDGNGKFTNVISQVVPHTPWFSMGTDLGDVNNDGLIDFLATDMSATTHYRDKVMMGDMDDLWFLEFPEPRQYMRNAVYLNSDTDRMLEAAFLCGLASTDWTWSPRMADFDNDGRLDLFVTNGVIRDMMNSDLNNYAEKEFERGSPEWARFWEAQEMRKETNLAFRNEGDLHFTRTEKAWGLDHTGVSLGAATADFDNDGDLDMVVSNVDVPVSVYRNRSRDASAIAVRLQGVQSNRSGLGATVRLEANGQTQVRYVTMSRGWLSSTAPVLHFGLGAAEIVDELTIDWPSGCRQTFRELDVDHAYTITEPAATDSPLPATDAPETLFVQAPERAADVSHQENEFDDFAIQPLLPNRLSVSGPAFAAGDIDQDGDEDFFLGGSKGHAGRLLINDGGKLIPRSVEAFAQHHEHEDTSAVFFDADGDSDQDLFVVSGSTEEPPGHESYRDRLYLNDGNGRFVAAQERLPDIRESGSAAAACDFDQDGDVDVFVGSRCIPGKYPLAGKNRLFVNDGSAFQESTPSPLADCGMVTDAVWADLDGDGWTDLVATTDWGPVKVFLNREGELVDATQTAGLDGLLGWWTAITAADVDGDGDVDLIAGNFGLNTKYRASAEKPELLYYGVFDDTGMAHIIEAKFADGVCVPRRGFSCSQNAMPFLKEKLETYHNFAISSLPELYGENQLADAVELKANTLESGVLLNDGGARFTFRPLPRLAQIAPSLDLVTDDFNGDGHLDLVLLHNFYGPQRETGRMDGGLSLLLTGDGSGDFQPVWPNASGIVLRADPRHIAAVDVNADGRRDLVIAVNNGPLAIYETRPAAAAKHVAATER